MEQLGRYRLDPTSARILRDSQPNNKDSPLCVVANAELGLPHFADLDEVFAAMEESSYELVTPDTLQEMHSKGLLPNKLGESWVLAMEPVVVGGVPYLLRIGKDLTGESVGVHPVLSYTKAGHKTECVWFGGTQWVTRRIN